MNPQNLKNFPKGVSGNPNGRPKGARSLSTILREMLDEDIKVIEGGVEVKKKFKDVLVRKLLKKANDGDLKAIDMIFDRTEGKPEQKIEQTNIERTIVWGDADNDNQATFTAEADSNASEEA